MSIIDEVIKDKKLEEVVYFLAERMMRRAREYSKAQFKKEKVDLTIDQWVILKRVSEEIGISQVEIASSTYKDPAAVTRILDILVRKGVLATTVIIANACKCIRDIASIPCVGHGRLAAAKVELHLRRRGKRQSCHSHTLLCNARAKGTHQCCGPRYHFFECPRVAAHLCVLHGG